MNVPIYIVTGFLDAGKTTFINERIRDRQDKFLLLLQFESGDEDLNIVSDRHEVMKFNKKQMEEQPASIVAEMNAVLSERTPEEIWIEYNGMAMFSQLYELLLKLKGRGAKYRVERVIHLTEYGMFRRILGRTGAGILEQAANSDLAVVRGEASSEEKEQLRNTLRTLSENIKVYEWESEREKIDRTLETEKIPTLSRLAMGSLVLGVAFWVMTQSMDALPQSANKVLNIFLGMVFQAVPFLLIGVLLSSLIQVFISKEAIERLFPKSLLGGMLTAIVAGFFLPVCDCASIPIFRSLVKKGVPLPAAVTFMTATPVINPVVMLSTYYAFNASMRVVFARVALGILSAAGIGLMFHLFPTKSWEKFSQNFDANFCNCGCYEGVENTEGLLGKWTLFLRHSQIEFFNVGKYLMIGAFVTAVLQTGLSSNFAASSSSDFAVAILMMMLMAFLLSLCSSSDAMIAKGLVGRFPMASTMGFLVFGPMMDVKNVLLLSGYFSNRFIVKLIAVTAGVSFVTVFLLSRLLLGV